MRLIAIAFVILFSLAQGLRSEEAQPTRAYTVECRFIDLKGDVVNAPRMRLIDGQNGSVSLDSQRSIVNAVTSENGVDAPHILVLKEGLTIDVTVLGQPDQKAAVDATVEVSGIGPISVKSGRQTAIVDSQKKRVIDLVSLGETLVIPTGKKGKARVELTVNIDGDVSRSAAPASTILCSNPIPVKASSPGVVLFDAPPQSASFRR
jgi:hypothetical protein